MHEILNFSKQLLADKGNIIYITQFGSHLYGTNSPTSDADYKGIFLPAIEDLVLCQSCKSAQNSTGDNNAKNSPGDIDIQFWSLQYWLQLLAAGDTGALDLLFSIYCGNQKKYIDKEFAANMTDLNPLSLIDIKNNRRYIDYVRSQAKKYGLKGTRLGFLKELLNYIDAFYEKEKAQGNSPDNIRAGSLFQDILAKFDPAHLFSKPGVLFILGKGYSENIKLSEMRSRLQNEYNKFGERAKLAEKNECIDWKAISHAMRCLLQMRELIQTGALIYPLQNADFLKDIKYGKYQWNEIQKQLVEELAEVSRMAQLVKDNPDMILNHRKLILKMYGLTEE